MQQTLSSTALRFLGNLPLEANPELSRTAPAPETGRDAIFLETLRANLHAAARHAALGHTEASFRECSGPACREAAGMLPEMASLEKEGTSFLALRPS